MVQWARLTCANLRGREHLRQSDVADGCLWLAVADSSLRLDPADRLETWESGCVGKPIDCQDRCPPPFAAAMRLLPGLEEGEVACGSEAFLGGRIERSVVALEDQGILRFGGEHLPGHLRMAMQGVARHRAALQAQTLEKSQSCLHLGTAGSTGIGYRQPRLAFPHAHHERRHMRLPLLVSAAQSFAVDRHNSLRRRQTKLPRNAVMNAVKARANSTGSSSRKTRLKVSWLGMPCSSGTISRNSASRPSPNSAICTKPFAPHSVAASATNNISANT